MLGLRYVYLLALVVWLGGMIVLGALVAPTAFALLPQRDPVSGRALAGDLFGATLGRFNLVAYGSGTIMLGCLIGRALLGPRPVGFKVRVAIVAATLGISVFSGTWLTWRIERLQRELAPRAVGSLPSGDPRRAQFNRLHRLSELLGMTNVVGGLVLLLWEAAE